MSNLINDKLQSMTFTAGGQTITCLNTENCSTRFQRNLAHSLNCVSFKSDIDCLWNAEQHSTWSETGTERKKKRKKEEKLSPYLWCIHSHGGQIVGILLIPRKSQQRNMRRVLIDDGGMFQMAEVKHSNWAISTYRSKKNHTFFFLAVQAFAVLMKMLGHAFYII